MGGRPAERVAVEKGVDCAACALVLQRLEKKDREASDLVDSLNRQAVRVGLKPDLQATPIYRYSCEPE